MKYFSKSIPPKPEAKRYNDFAAIGKQFKDEFKTRKYHAIRNNPQKNNAEADRLMKSGQQLAHKRQWKAAAEQFNLCLCMAECGSLNEKLAYSERAKCFAERKLYDKVAIDFDLAKFSEPPFKIPKHNARNLTTHKHMEFEPKLSFRAHDSFPSMANVLEIKQNEKFGRYVIAKCDIDIGQTIFVAEQFASAIYAHHPKQAYCLTCHKIDANFIACAQCTSAMFCSPKCQQINDVHKTECNTIFHRTTSSVAKLAMQLLLNAIKHFPNADAFIKFVNNALDSSDDINNLALGPLQAYGLVLRLNTQKDGDIYLCYQAFKILMTIPIICNWFNSKEKRTFLKRLLLRHLAIIDSNGFSEFIGLNDALDMSYIYDSMSLFNHSCAPNAFYAAKNNVGFLVTVRPIKKGDQIFINYLGDLSTQPNSKRQQFLMDKWKFQCECERCESPNFPNLIIENQRKIMQDKTIRYVISHSDDHELPFGHQQRQKLAQKCVKVMATYGHIWSKTLDNVINLFILSSLENV